MIRPGRCPKAPHTLQLGSAPRAVRGRVVQDGLTPRGPVERIQKLGHGLCDLAKGLEITVCEACAEARGYHKEDVPEGMKRASMDWYLAKTVKTDRLLHIGGE